MTDFVFITANDIHVSDTGPRSRTDDFKGAILGKIGQMRAACKKLNADAALIAGDLYNLKNPSKNSHQLNQELIAEFRKFPCPIYMIPGNHDLTGNSLESLNEQPLGVLFADGTLIRLDTQKVEIEKEDYKVSIVGVPYLDKPDIEDLKIPEKGECVAQICLLHQYASPKGGMLFKERLFGYDELAELGADVYVIGHYHLDQGVTNQDGKHFINIGSMSRGTISEEDIEHEPQLGYIRVSADEKTTISAQSIKLKIRPASEVFDLTKKEEEKQESKEIKEFVEKLIAESPGTEADSKDNIEDIIEKLDTDKKVKDKVAHFLLEASSLL